MAFCAPFFSLDFLTSKAAALYCRLPFTLFAETLVNQMASVGVSSVKGGASRIGEGLTGCFRASGPAFLGI